MKQRFGKEWGTNVDKLDQLERFARNGMSAQAAVDALTKKAAVLEESELIAEFAKELKVAPEEIENLMIIGDEGGGHFDVGDIRYRFFWDEDEAENIATIQVLEDLQTQPEIFNQDWLQGHFDDDKWLDAFRSDAEEWVRESPESYTAFVDNEEPEEDGSYSEDQIERMVEGYLEDIKKRGVTDFLTGDLGYSGEDLARQILPYIDIQKAAEDAIATDGWPHFISNYDGSYETTERGLVYFRD